MHPPEQTITFNEYIAEKQRKKARDKMEYSYQELRNLAPADYRRIQSKLRQD